MDPQPQPGGVAEHVGGHQAASLGSSLAIKTSSGWRVTVVAATTVSVRVHSAWQPGITTGASSRDAGCHLPAGSSHGLLGRVLIRAARGRRGHQLGDRPEQLQPAVEPHRLGFLGRRGPGQRLDALDPDANQHVSRFSGFSSPAIPAGTRADVWRCGQPAGAADRRASCLLPSGSIHPSERRSSRVHCCSSRVPMGLVSSTSGGSDVGPEPAGEVGHDPVTALQQRPWPSMLASAHPTRPSARATAVPPLKTHLAAMIGSSRRPRAYQSAVQVARNGSTDTAR